MSPPLSPWLVYQGVVLAVLLSLLGLLLINMAVLPNLRDFPAPSGTRLRPWTPLVSVLVPARDESGNIADCIAGLLAQDYLAFEVLALDDGSTDGTGAILDGLAAADPRLRVLHGSPLPPGWLGKAHACRQLADAARGELLLFTDADVRHAPAALGHAVALLEARDLGLLSLFPTQVTVSPMERLVVPLMQHFAVYVLLPLPLMTGLRAPAFAAANGQFMLFRRSAYEAAGGHEGVRAALLEDVALARAVKAAGARIALADGNGLVRCRMYNGAAGVWSGFSKNLFTFFNRSRLFLAVGLAAAVLLWVLPLGVGVWGLWAGDTAVAVVSLAQYAVAVVARLVLARRFGGRVWDALLHPLGVVLLVAIGVNSARGGAVWKGRRVG
ncbi:MAG: glycosyltransferase [Chloroflexia bacterium]